MKETFAWAPTLLMTNGAFMKFVNKKLVEFVRVLLLVAGKVLFIW
jgi:hypothetical protein